MNVYSLCAKKATFKILFVFALSWQTNKLVPDSKKINFPTHQPKV